MLGVEEQQNKKSEASKRRRRKRLTPVAKTEGCVCLKDSDR